MVKKLLPSIIVLLILAASVGYAYSQNFFQKKQEAVPAEAKLLTLNTDQIKQIIIHSSVMSEGTDSSNSSGEETTQQQAEASVDNENATSSKPGSSSNAVTLVNSNNHWALIKPAAYPVNEYMVADWLDTLQSATVHGIVEQSPTDVSKYGMQADQPSIALTTISGQQMTISFGGETPEHDYYYARVNNGPIVQVAEQTLNDLSGATAFHFIDTTPLGWDDQQLSKLIWKGSKPVSTWTLTHQLSTGGDPNQDKWSLNEHSITPSEAGSITDAIKNIPTDELPVAVNQIKGYKQVLTLDLQLMNAQDHNTGADGTANTEQYTGWQAPDDPSHIWIVELTGTWAYRLPMDSVDMAAKTVSDVLAGKGS